MIRVEFYVLPGTDPRGRLNAACQLAAKGWRHGMPVFVRCQDEAQIDQMDDLLWRFKPASFVPHAAYSADPLSPVVLGANEAPETTGGLLVNLDPKLPEHIERFSRVIEIVNQSPEQLTVSRENFRQYRVRGYDPQRVEL